MSGPSGISPAIYLENYLAFYFGIFGYFSGNSPGNFTNSLSGINFRSFLGTFNHIFDFTDEPYAVLYVKYADCSYLS